jgi:hypothetical protein
VIPTLSGRLSFSRSDFNHERKASMNRAISSDGLPNAQRIATARSALKAAMETRGEDFPVSNEAVIDLLADLRHFCTARHIDFALCDRVAQTSFDAEITGGQR